MACIPSVTLNTALKMPLFGLGTHKAVGYSNVYRMLDEALKLGYRLIDTAAVYRNEEDIGTCLKELLPKYGLNRSDIFITSKLAPKDQGEGAAYKACVKSIERLECEYLDLYLIHWPGKQKLKPHDVRNRQFRMESWLDLEKLLNDGLVKNIGVSNYNVRHLDDMLTYSTIPPAVLQVEYHPLLVQKDLVAWCQKQQVHLQAYRSIAIEEGRSDPLVIGVAEKHAKTVSQVLLKWAIQQDIGVIPKSTNEDHLKENIDIWDFDLTQDEITDLEKLHKGTRFCWDPTPMA
ncbi:glyoxal reductase-like [Ptychodera flava]|uniref:glyoxal reductase-like n=1 Tax=Ptychodera flava TaxID=63121 RepID=UPI00396A531D